MITRKKQLLLSFLKVRAVINGKDIYQLPAGEPVCIRVMANNPKVVITDGYHVAKPLELVYHHLHTYYFKVICIIDNTQLVAGLFLIGSLFTAGLYTGLWLVKLTSSLPVLYFLFFYYVNRKEFLQITPV